MSLSRSSDTADQDVAPVVNVTPAEFAIKVTVAFHCPIAPLYMLPQTQFTPVDVKLPVQVSPRLFTLPLFAITPVEQLIPPVTVSVPELKVPPIPAFPPVESVVAVRLPVMLLVPFIDIPPDEFEICPLAVTCPQDTAASVEVPDTYNVPVTAVLPMRAIPEALVIPAHASDAVESSPTVQDPA